MNNRESRIGAGSAVLAPQFRLGPALQTNETLSKRWRFDRHDIVRETRSSIVEPRNCRPMLQWVPVCAVEWTSFIASPGFHIKRLLRRIRYNNSYGIDTRRFASSIAGASVVAAPGRYLQKRLVHRSIYVIETAWLSGMYVVLSRISCVQR